MPESAAHGCNHRAEVTLVVPLRDEALTIAALIRSIEGQSRPPDRVVLVDAGSLDATAEIASDACGRHLNWTLIDAGPAMPGTARNIGIAASTTEWIALTDAGIELDGHWLERLVRMAAADPEVELVWGHYEPAPDGWFTACAGLAYLSPPRDMGSGPVRDASIACCLLQKQAWQRAGHFPDFRAAEDRIFMRRLQRAGIRAVVAPEAVVWWHLQDGFVSTFRRFRVYSRVNVLAGEQRSWHYNVARMYVVAIPFVLMAALHRRRWAVLPLVGAAVRVAGSIWRGREGRGVGWAANPARFATVGAILATVDAATFAGWLDARRRHRVLR